MTADIVPAPTVGLRWKGPSKGFSAVLLVLVTVPLTAVSVVFSVVASMAGPCQLGHLTPLDLDNIAGAQSLLRGLIAVTIGVYVLLTAILSGFRPWVLAASVIPLALPLAFLLSHQSVDQWHGYCF